MRQLVKTLVTQFQHPEPIQTTFDRLDEMVAKLGNIQVLSIQDTIHSSEPPPTPHDAEYGFKLFPGDAAVVRIVVFTRNQ